MQDADAGHLRADGSGRTAIADLHRPNTRIRGTRFGGDAAKQRAGAERREGSGDTLRRIHDDRGTGAHGVGDVPSPGTERIAGVCRSDETD